MTQNKAEICLDKAEADTSAIEIKCQKAILFGSQVFPCLHFFLHTKFYFIVMLCNCPVLSQGKILQEYG